MDGGKKSTRPDWPDEERPATDVRPKAGRFARLVRYLGDAFITAGMSRGLAGDRGASDARAASNVMLFGEGAAKGGDANRGSGPE